MAHACATWGWSFLIEDGQRHIHKRPRWSTCISATTCSPFADRFVDAVECVRTEKANHITYFYVSESADEASVVDDFHFHPVSRARFVFVESTLLTMKSAVELSTVSENFASIAATAGSGMLVFLLGLRHGS